MFEEQDKNDGVEDILATTEPTPAASEVPLGPPSALAQGKLQPIQPGAARPAVPPTQISAAGRVGFPVKKIIAAVVVILLVGGAAGAGYFWWSGQPNNEPVSPAPTATDNDSGDDAGLNQAIDQLQQKAINQALDPFAPPVEPVSTSAAAPAGLDTDQDGLNDADEMTAGTNPRLVDTDGDSLSDWEEVTVFGTNPLVPDTDGDTYPDGSEVQNGYNPKGPGKLLDFEKAKATAQ